MNQKRLQKSDDKILLGVCGGIAEFIGWSKKNG
jgi:phage shock protein PspC (stress-responsive transcriptional regulator)